ncbi:MAG: FAD binding domain-containing protein, partial [Bacteroidales bacterium]|nr:FAD binding domain-containing protein [Bacteroidales bacterium]
LLFLPMIHGKQLITVEGLAEKNGDHWELHPVQKELIQSFGSQCGYCTPGIIMSLFALYKNHDNPSKTIINDALTGNLCRCTGYRPIIEAAEKACASFNGYHPTKKEKNAENIFKNFDSLGKSIAIESQGQRYFRPATLHDALLLIKKHPNAHIVIGGSDIAIKQTKNHEFLEEIIDISGLRELKEHSEDQANIYLGAGLSLEEVRTIVDNKIRELHHILSHFGSLQIRNMATLGGNLGTASPISDTLPVLIARNAKVILKNSKKERTLTIESFIKGYRKTSINPGELIFRIVIPKTTKGILFKAYKLSKRKELDISSVSGAFRLQLDNEKRITDIALVFGGMAEMPKKAVQTELFLLKKKFDRQTIETAMKILYDEFMPITDARASDVGRKLMARNLLMKFYNDV